MKPSEQATTTVLKCTDIQPCEVCEEVHVTTIQRVIFNDGTEDGLRTNLTVCEQCLADGVADEIITILPPLWHIND